MHGPPYKIGRETVRLTEAEPTSFHHILIPLRENLTSIDLFAGCGGISLGFERAGIEVLAAIDSDLKAIEVYRSNLPNVPHVLHEAPATIPEDLVLARVLELNLGREGETLCEMQRHQLKSSSGNG